MLIVSSYEKKGKTNHLILVVVTFIKYYSCKAPLMTNVYANG